MGDGTNSASYSYLANSRLIDHIDFANLGTTRMVTTKQWDFLDRLTNIVSTTGGVAVASFAYGLNSANQRTSSTNVDGTFWVYTYDALGQVISGKKYWSDGSPIAGQQFEYAFDDIGNRTSTGEGGDSRGRNLRRAKYSANNLNQYTSRDVPPYLSILGSAATNATVSLWANNGSFATTYRRNDFFRGELSFNNSTGSLWLTITNVGVLRNGTNADIVTNVIGSAFVPQTAEVFGYDADGNMTNDGRWSISWDAENRVTNFSRRSGVAGPRLTCRRTCRFIPRRVRLPPPRHSVARIVVSEALGQGPCCFGPLMRRLQKNIFHPHP